MFEQLEDYSRRPAAFAAYTAELLWADPHISEQMLGYHLDGELAAASRTSKFIKQSLDWLVTKARIRVGSDVLDLGCGPGLYTNPIAALGANTTGVDFSERSLIHARSNAPTTGATTTYIHGNYLDVDIPGDFDVILMAMCDFCALSPTQRRVLLDRVRSMLRLDGQFIFDVYGLRSMRDRNATATYAPMLMDGFWSPDRYHGFLHTFIYERESVSLDRYDIIEADRSRTIYNWLQHFSPVSIEEELANAGLAVDEFFGDLQGSALVPDPTEFCIVAINSGPHHHR